MRLAYYSVLAFCLLVGGVFFGEVSGAQAQECHFYEYSPHVVNRIDLVSPRGMDYDGTHVYVAAFGNGITITDATDPSNPMIVGNTTTSYNPLDVAVVGNFAYLASYTYGLEVVDVSNPAVPTLVGGVGLGYSTSRIAAQGSHAYVVSGPSGFAIVDVSNPTSPSVISGPIGYPGSPVDAQDVALVPGYAFVADRRHGLIVVDISDPLTASVVSILPVGANGAFRLAVESGTAYVHSQSNGINVVDVSDPTSPVLNGTVPISGTPFDMAIEGNHLLVSGSALNNLVFDISGPGLPVQVGSVGPLNASNGMVPVENCIYVTTNTDLHVIDATYPVNPLPIGSLPGSTYGVDIDLEGSLAYVCQSSKEYRVVDLSDPTNPVVLGAVNTPDFIHRSAVADGYAYVADRSSLQVVDVSDPSNPTIVASVVGIDAPREVVADNGIVVVGSYPNVLYFIDVANPLAPSVVGSIAVPGYAQGRLEIQGGVVFVPSNNSGLVMVDFSTPSAPTTISSLTVPGTPTGVVVSGNRAYLSADYEGLVIVDITDPLTPAILGQSRTGHRANQVFLSLPYAYVADESGGLAVLDVGLPTDPVYLGGLVTLGDHGSARSLALGNGLAYFTGYPNSVTVAPLYCNDPVPAFLSLFEIEKVEGRIDINWQVGSMDGNQEFRLLARHGSKEWNIPFRFDWSDGFHASINPVDINVSGSMTLVLEYREASGAWYEVTTEKVDVVLPEPMTRLVSVSPNPFNPKMNVEFELTRPQPVMISIFDLRGRRVARLSNEEFSAGRHVLAWDGKNDAGLAMASGTYVVRLEAADGAETRKVLLAR